MIGTRIGTALLAAAWLLAAVPVADPERAAQRPVPEGEIPSPVRAVGDEPAIHRLHPVGPNHFAAVEA